MLVMAHCYNIKHPVLVLESTQLRVVWGGVMCIESEVQVEEIIFLPLFSHMELWVGFLGL